jgi:VIT1/CCC1 family predicted Fe2+/Mn2+ transporter
MLRLQGRSAVPDQKTWRDNWQREIEGEYLYRKLSEIARDPAMRQALADMAADEARHAAVWQEMSQTDGHRPAPPRPDLRIYLILGLARLFGIDAVKGLLLNDEVNDFSAYASQAHDGGDEDTYGTVLADEASHARAIAALQDKSGPSTEPWHRTAGAGGWLRAVVYGFNDGLTANFGLVMGVVGGSVADATILLAGSSGLVADALSMAGSGFLAARSEEEVREHHLALERAELQFMPDEERRELARSYERRGLTQAEAETVADQLMARPRIALQQLARDELGLDPEAPGDPLREGILTGIATGLGAFIPILPFLFLPSSVAVWVAVGISMLAHFAVGASRAIFTGRPALRSGFEMFAVGMGVALVAFGLGHLIHVGL